MRRALTAISVLSLLLGTVGCARGPGDPPSPAGPSDPLSTPTADADGWIALFDGSSTDAWRAYGGEAFPTGSWSVADGALTTVAGQPVDLISRATFGDFELEFEWRVAPAGNGGVMYRVAETADPPWLSGPEFQVLDDGGHADGQRAETSAGAAYDLIAPSADKPLAPVGEFNHARIVVRDGRVEHWLDDMMVLAYDWDGDDVQARIDASKFKDAPGFMTQDEGHVVLQHHGEVVAYRSVRIRLLAT